MRWLPFLLLGLATSPLSAQTLTKQLESEPIRQLAEDAQRFGDSRRGALAFYHPSMNCARCHESQESGRRLGPDLSEQRKFKLGSLVQSLLYPSAEIKTGFETSLFQLTDGKQLQGIMVEQTDAHFLVDRIEQPEEPLRLDREDVDEWKQTKLSSMPEGLVNQLADRQQFLDLISYLAAIAAGGPTRAVDLKPAGAMMVMPLPTYESRIDHAGLIRSLDEDSLKRGAETFRLRCQTCHGTINQEGSLPTSLRFATDQFKNGNDPYRMYKTLTHGFGMMNPQRWMVPQQKYEVIHYLREHLLRPLNPDQFFEVTDEYLASLPVGDTRGPKPVDVRPWTIMDYGPSLINTIEVSDDGSNIAQKGIAIRLDQGPGGVESGSHWLMYEHDTLRVAAAWCGKFIDWEGIHFNGAHGRHPRVAGTVHLANPTGPGFAKPSPASAPESMAERFKDDRMIGRDGKHYGPLQKDWARYLGLYRYGKQTIIKYRVADTTILETPGLTFIEDRPVYSRTLNVGTRSQDLVMQVAKVGGVWESFGQGMICLDKEVLEEDQDKFPLTKAGLLVATSLEEANWVSDDAGNLRLRVPAGRPLHLVISHCPIQTEADAIKILKQLPTLQKPQDLSPLTTGGPSNYPETLTMKIIRGDKNGPFAVDVFERPQQNPWNCQLRLTGLDFLPGGDCAVVSAWDGSVWRVSGFGSADSDTLTWQRIAAGLFQPLGIKVVDQEIYVACRDQIVILHDLNGDGEADWYENFNSDHQVTEHFHEFAMGLQADEDGNFYYAKSARHALPALVPHHGTLLKVTSDGKQTEILANGFRAANGVCLNPDGSFVVTDQEGHWNPKNRINWVRPRGFYGNMFAYHDVTDESDAAMDDPLCWITNSFDRSPAELLWVDSKKWGPLNGCLLNFSYGYGQIHVVPHEEIEGQMQGGMCALPIEKFPTGVMRGRFHPGDGQLYCCGMFAWAGDQQQPGGFYRIRYTGKPVHLPVGLHAKTNGLEIRFSDEIDRQSAGDPKNFAIITWDLKRTSNYGSEHYNEQRLLIEKAELQPDGKTIKLTIPEIKPTWGMEINYALRTSAGKKLPGKIHNTIHRLK